MAIRIDGTNTTANPGITGADADTGLQFGTNELKLVTGGTEAVKIDSNQKLTASQGILFGTDTAAANTIDDYEEGSWTPVYAGSTTAGTYTYSAQVGSYTKIGNRVFVQCTLNSITASSAGSGNMQITGLPFTASSTSNDFSVGPISLRRIDLDAATRSLYCNPSTGTNLLSPQQVRDNTTNIPIPVTSIGAGTSSISLSICYYVD